MPNPSRRQTPRVEVQLSAAVCEPTGRRRVLEGDILNLSEGGAFFSSRELLPIGTQVIVRISTEGIKEIEAVVSDLGPDENASAQADVRWSRETTQPTGFGIEFRNLTESARTKIATIIRYFENLKKASS